jgi:predicted AlkP superfamily pyrophosphatase or phosphodiesterase
MLRPAIAAFALFTFGQPAFAQTIVYQGTPATSASDAISAAPANGTAPKLIVAISVDQLSADLFAEYRGQFTGGLARMQQGAVFPSGYQAQAASETCPGHSTILTGNHPARTGIFANEWIDINSPRDDKTIYCAEDESVAGSTSKSYTVSDVHLKVPTLGERMKAANPQTRVVSVAGKDRAAVMLGGHKVDELWWWDGKRYSSYAGRTEPAAVTRVNALVNSAVKSGVPENTIPSYCNAHRRAVAVPGGSAVGTGALGIKPGDFRGMRATPYFDLATADLAVTLAAEMKLGKGAATDLLAIGASATDYIGHTYGTAGSEMCINLFALDNTLGKLFDKLDGMGVDYAAVLTADHGGHDLPERIQEQSLPQAARVSADLSSSKVGEAIGAAMKLKLPQKTQLLYGSAPGDVWINNALSKNQKAKVAAKAIATYRASPFVSGVYTRAEILAVNIPSSPAETWTVLQRIRASYDTAKGGDFYVVLNPRITPIPDGSRGYVATHGSVWDYDRRVPILFWRKGMARFEQPLSVMTVDIAPTLAALIGLTVPAGAMDGRCLDLDAGSGTTCK